MSAYYEKFRTNPLKTKIDFQNLVIDLFIPLIPYLKEQGAMLDFNEGGAKYDMKACSLEGIARILWGVVPLVAGGGEFPYWKLVRNAITQGTDPQHKNFWGDTQDMDQRSVEMAALGYMLALAPDHTWKPLNLREKSNLVQWLAKIQNQKMPQNNWLFFTVLVQAGLRNVGCEDLIQSNVEAEYLSRLESWYIGKGWYGDGEKQTIDHYGGFAMHFYGLIYASLPEQSNPCLAQLFRKRASDFANPFKYWFAATGESLVQGRSLTYRFATAGFWGALAIAEECPIPIGEIKGLWARQIRHWKNKPIFTTDGRLTRGYDFPNLQMCEVYNSPTSPYWSMKAFLPLLLSNNSSFWKAEEQPLQISKQVMAMPESKTIAQRINGHSIIHYAAPVHPFVQKDKYNKFAYTTAGGMDINSLLYSDQNSFGDNIFAFSFDNGKNWQMRDQNLSVYVDKECIKVIWKSGNIEIESLIEVLKNGASVRTHTFELLSDAWVVETGFAVGQWYIDAEIINPLNFQQGMYLQPSQVLSLIGSNAKANMASIDNNVKQAFTSTRTHTDVSFPRSCVPFFLTKLKAGKHQVSSRYQLIPTVIMDSKNKH